VIEMIIGSYDKTSNYTEYNIGSGQGVSVNQLVAALEKCTGQTAEKINQETPSTFVHTSVLAIDRYISEFNIKPGVSLEDGISRTWNYVKELS
jgi:UDP-glucose 4-epimerase